MGRVARYKKVKDIRNDVRWKAQEAKKDQAPSRGEGNKPTRAMRRLLESKRLMEKIKSGEFVGKAEQRRKQMNDAKKAVPKQAGESEAAYESRLERTYNDMVSESIKKVTKKSEKRKAYLEGKKKRKQQPEPEVVEKAPAPEYKRDVVKFGETNAAPPSLSATPRRRHNMKAKSAPLLLDQKLEEVKNQQGAVRRKDMDATQQKQHDVARQQAIDQYRALKKQREAERNPPEQAVQ